MAQCTPLCVVFVCFMACMCCWFIFFVMWTHYRQKLVFEQMKQRARNYVLNPANCASAGDASFAIHFVKQFCCAHRHVHLIGVERLHPSVSQQPRSESQQPRNEKNTRMRKLDVEIESIEGSTIAEFVNVGNRTNVHGFISFRFNKMVCILRCKNGSLLLYHGNYKVEDLQQEGILQRKIQWSGSWNNMTVTSVDGGGGGSFEFVLNGESKVLLH